MYDIWGFLLQTMNAAAVAVLVLALKALFRDKLPPKWQFAVWSVVGIAVVLPAGLFGRYALFDWALPVSLIRSWFGDYGTTQVRFPVPVIRSFPKGLDQWVFAGYVAGVAVCMLRYLMAYVRLRRVLRQGQTPAQETMDRLRAVAAAQEVKLCKVVRIPGLPSAFVCGVLHPVLAIGDGDPEDAVILHELLHLRYKDTLWSMVICLLRCLHWCDPVLTYCADRAVGDMEARCDQHVLERLEGEQRREYGRTLLSMVNDRFAKIPGSTCFHNGGRQIRRRIEAIARSKLYPVGMELVSACTIVVLAFSLVVGVEAKPFYDGPTRIALASVRGSGCTTAAGAFDTYAKAVLEQNGVYRAMCASQTLQPELTAQILDREGQGLYPNWDPQLPAFADRLYGYYIYGLRSTAEDVYEGLLVIRLAYPPEGQPETEGMMDLAVQSLRVRKEHRRWVAEPLEPFRAIQIQEQQCGALPGTVYAGTVGDLRLEVWEQTVCTVVQDRSAAPGAYDTTPKPDAQFKADRSMVMKLHHLGTEAERGQIWQVGMSVMALDRGQERTEPLHPATGQEQDGISGENCVWTSCRPSPGWGPELELSNCGWSDGMDTRLPHRYAADLYINDELCASLELYPEEVLP